MKFKNNSQRKAVMAKLKNITNTEYTKFINKASRQKNITRMHAHVVKNMDYDGDGIKNKNDCKPFDPEKQGWMHNMTLQWIKRKEEKIERQREKAQQKYNDTMDELRARRALSKKNINLKNIQLKTKQNMINELNREKEQLSKIKNAERKANKEIDKYTKLGKLKSRIGKGYQIAKSRIGKGYKIATSKKAVKGYKKFFKKINKIMN